ncbi:permease [Mesoaciditoga lauensis]|uniref:permease n=1 Tax=Mesoaciditoga lauensis TaxID=1495039 RepID=UPI00056A00E8|nr:permease [Mesoaciditoga lauensis]
MNVWGVVVYGAIVVLSYIYAFKKDKKGGKKAVKKSGVQFLKQLPMLITIFLLIGLFDKFVPKSMVMQVVGKGKGFLSLISSAAFGTIVMGPVSSAYPLGGILLEKGATITAVAVFLNAWVMVGFVTLPYEISIFGKRFTLVRNTLAFIGALVIGILTGLILGVI